MNKLKLAMGLLIVSEGTFFIFLILAYVYFRAIAPGPSFATGLDPLKTGIFSLFLFASSGTMWGATNALKSQNYSRVGGWLLVSALFGGVFLVGQGFEYVRLIQENVTIGSGLFGTTFFTLTGFHGFHVFMGFLVLLILFGLTCTRKFGPSNAIAVESAAMYWHFVDAVWVAIFLIVYLWAFL